jgi:hypothetical protein
MDDRINAQKIQVELASQWFVTRLVCFCCLRLREPDFLRSNQKSTGVTCGERLRDFFFFQRGFAFFGHLIVAAGAGCMGVPGYFTISDGDSY